MKGFTYLSLFVALIIGLAQLISVHAIQCRTCSENCSSSQSVSEWKIEDCPGGDHMCNLVWDRNKNGLPQLNYGGCSNNKISACTTDTERNEVCIETCEGNLCNQEIDISKSPSVDNVKY